MTAVLRLWLVRHAGEPVALVVADSRTDAVRRTSDLPASTDLAIGEMTASAVGTALAGARVGVLTDLRVTAVATEATTRRQERARNRHARRAAAAPICRQAYLAGARVGGLDGDDQQWNQSRRTTAIRRTIWAAMRAQDLTLRQVAEASGHHIGTVAVGLTAYHRLPGDPVLDAVWEATVAALDAAPCAATDGSYEDTPC